MRLPLLLLSIFLYLAPTSDLRAQNTTVQDSFRNYLEIQESLTFVSLYFDLVEDADQLFPIAEEYLLAAPKAEKRKFYRLILSIGARAKQESIKKQTISYMLQAYEEEQRPGYGIYYLDRLTIFNRQLFDKRMKTRLRTLLRKSRRFKKDTNQLILLAGFLQMKEQKEYLWSEFVGTYVQKPTQEDTRFYYHSEEWTAYLALARMGDKRALKLVLQRFHEEQDNFNKCIFLVEDLAYTGQKRAFKALVGVLIEDIKTIPNYELSTPCGAYIVSALVKGLKNYPHNIPSSYFMESKEQVIKWFRNHRKLVMNRDVF